ncbi:MAG: Asp-tRNA(Asn)/Glu-tRNA(Gln) amidotransferase subunit GatC [Pseudomonadota bacterium]|nr:Asp-tRNA(Asn)/Glu-tRNA(Gln) amidotransferase subunit GatC [Pseudomonadota bacterium]
MSIEPDELERIAALARLQIAPDRQAELQRSLNEILAMVEQLQAVDTTGVAPLAHPLDATQRLRPDQVTEGDERERFQGLAPATERGYYLVPKVIE